MIFKDILDIVGKLSAQAPYSAPTQLQTYILKK